MSDHSEKISPDHILYKYVNLKSTDVENLIKGCPSCKAYNFSYLIYGANPFLVLPNVFFIVTSTIFHLYNFSSQGEDNSIYTRIILCVYNSRVDYIQDTTQRRRIQTNEPCARMTISGWISSCHLPTVALINKVLVFCFCLGFVMIKDNVIIYE